MIITDRRIRIPPLFLHQGVSQRLCELVGYLIRCFEVEKGPDARLSGLGGTRNVAPAEPNHPQSRHAHVNTDLQALSQQSSVQHPSMFP